MSCAFRLSFLRESLVTPGSELPHSEYIKLRLYNKDSRFCNDAQYMFYLLWQKEMRELSPGVYNLLKSTRSQATSVSALLNKVEALRQFVHDASVSAWYKAVLVHQAKSTQVHDTRVRLTYSLSNF